MKKGFQFFEIGLTGGKHSVSKVYPTLLGAKRVRNRIHCECPFYKHIVESVHFPFNNIISALKVLYPKSDCITFKIV